MFYPCKPNLCWYHPTHSVHIASLEPQMGKKKKKFVGMSPVFHPKTMGSDVIVQESRIITGPTDEMRGYFWKQVLFLTRRWQCWKTLQSTYRCIHKHILHTHPFPDTTISARGCHHSILLLSWIPRKNQNQHNGIERLPVAFSPEPIYLYPTHPSSEKENATNVLLICSISRTPQPQ